MGTCSFDHVRVAGIKTVVPERFIDIDDELQYFGNSQKKLDRQKRMIGYGRRYVAASNTTFCDMAADAAEKLLDEMKVEKSQIGLLIAVNQKPDFREPCDACVIHGMLGLEKTCTTLNLNLGCAGWPHGLMVAHSLMNSGAFRYALVLAGDILERDCDPSNRKIAQVFGDAASATLLEYTRDEEVVSHFVTGSNGAGWDLLITPFGGIRHPLTKRVFDYLSEPDELGVRWNGRDPLMRGTEVFNFTMEVVPQLIKDTLAAAGWKPDEVGLYAVHQANKQILEMIASKAEVPIEKMPSETFTKYANNSTTSVVTVLCDQLQPEGADKVVVIAFGIGLSWASAALDLSRCYNGGIGTYVERKPIETEDEALKRWGEVFRTGT